MTYYEKLGCDSSSSTEDIRKAFKKLALQHHPDKGGDASKFQEINQAYEILSDPEKKQQYDHELRYGKRSNRHPFEGNPFARSPFGEAFNFSVGGMHFNFSNGMNVSIKKPSKKCDDVVQKLQISLEEAFKGFTKVIQRTIRMKCNSCVIECPSCKGQGVLMNVIPPGMLVQSTCNSCQGSGWIRQKLNCSECDGTIQTKTVDLIVSLPASNTINSQVRFEKQGEQAFKYNETPGDFIVAIEVQFPENCKVDDLNAVHRTGNIIYKPEISYQSLLCGDKIKIPDDLKCFGLEEEIELPPLSIKPGWNKVIREKGFYFKEQQRGHFIIEPTVLYNIDSRNVDIERLKSCFL